MHNKLTSIFWGIILIAIGVYALAQAMGYTPSQDPTVWAFIFSGISLVALVFYLVAGYRNWGWLFPVGVFGALAAILILVQAGADDPAIAAPIFIGVGLPFMVAFFIDRGKNWWALIPAGVMVFLVLVVLLVNTTRGEFIGAAFLLILALAFFLVYWSRRQLWAAIVAYVLFVIGLMPLLATTSHPEFAGSVFLLATSLPFLFVYFRSPQRWWAIIPGGILLTLAIVTTAALVSGVSSTTISDHIYNFILFAGIALTFATLWLRHHQRWGMIVAIIAAIAAIVGLFVTKVELAWPVLIILAGVYLLIRSLRPKRIEG